MPRDMSGTGRYPPVPLHQPTEFYGAVRLGDPERLFHVMSVDPYFITQDNGAGAPIHFATTYKQLDMVHHLLNNGADVNQRDDKGLTPLHRAAHLAQYDGYAEIYEYLLVGDDMALRVKLCLQVPPQCLCCWQDHAHPLCMCFWPCVVLNTFLGFFHSWCLHLHLSRNLAAWQTQNNPYTCCHPAPTMLKGFPFIPQ